MQLGGGHYVITSLRVSVCVGPGAQRGSWPRQADLPELLPGDEHLGEPLQLRSLLLHGVPDPVHRPTAAAQAHAHTKTSV